MDQEQRSHHETLKECRKNDRKIKELFNQAEEDRKNHTRLQDLVEKLQNKLKVYKHQLEEAEEIANGNLGKIRKAQLDLEAAQGRAFQAENQLIRVRSKQRLMSPDRERDREVLQRSASVAVIRAASVRR